ncbi:MAG: RNA-protein complex protein Nop10 [Candidatus Micrarchaeota archaeon]|nr:RNA-protein complex protein Nop10 [Candidatus Micrarchaeota archaeon]
MKKIRRCAVCSSYTLDDTHCGVPTKNPHPPKFSPQDRYAQYRRKMKGCK